MKFMYLMATVFVLLSTSLFAQQPLGIKEYPAIKFDGKPVKYDQTEIDQLLEDGMPRAALKLLAEQERKAIREQNVYAFYYSLSTQYSVMNEGYEEDLQVQQWIWKHSEMADSLPFPMNNLTHAFLAHWLKSGNYSRNDESLSWKKGNERVKIGNDRGADLINYHWKRSLDNPEALMQWGITFALPISEDFYYYGEHFSESVSDFTPTLFDFIANEYIDHFQEDYEYRYYRYDDNGDRKVISFNDSLSFGTTENLHLSADYQQQKNLLLPVYEARELLAWKHNRSYAYASVLYARLEFVNEHYQGSGNTDLLIKKALQDSEDKLLRRDDPASALFSYRIARDLAQDGKTWHWKNNPDPKDALVKALQKVDYSLVKYPKSKEAKRLTDLKEAITASEASFNLKSSLISRKPQLIEVNYRNLTSSVVSVYKINKYLTREEGTNPLRELQLEKVYTHNLAFDADPKMLSHTKDFILPAFPANGNYLVLLTPTAEKADELLRADSLHKQREYAYRIVTVSQLTVKNTSENGKTVLMVVDKLSGKPIAGAKVRFTRSVYSMGERKEVILRETVTDKNGFTDADYASSFNYTVKYKDDSISNYLYNYPGSEDPSLKTKLEIYTDRAIYRPGQTVYYKVIAYEDNNQKQEVVENYQVRIKAYDYNDEVLASESGRTNNYGSWSGSLQLPASGFLAGEIFLDINEGTARKDIRVEEYKRPTFDIVLDTVKTPYALGDSITISGKVKALAGYGIGGAEVTVSVSEDRYLPWGYKGSVRSYENRAYETVSDASGAFKITFATEKSKDLNGVSYSITLDAVSGTGETQSTEEYFYVGKERLSVFIYGGSRFFKQEQNFASVYVTNSSDVEQKDVTVNCTIERATSASFQTINVEQAEFQSFSEAQFREAFPKMHYYDNDQKSNFSEVYTGTLQSSDSISLNDLNLLPGAYRMICKVKDATGTEVKTEHSFTWIDLKSAKNQHEEGLWHHLSNTNPKPGEKVTLTIGTSAAAMPVYVEVFDGAKKLSAKWMTIKKRGKLIIPVSTETNNLLINMVGQSNEFDYNQSAYCQVQGLNEGLFVKLETKRDFLRPGSKEEWSMTVTNPDKSPVPAELLVAMYDASLNEFAANYWNTVLHYQPYFSRYWNNYSPSGLGYLMENWKSDYYYNGDDGILWRGSYGLSESTLTRREIKYAPMKLESSFFANSVTNDYATSPPPPPGEGMYSVVLDENGNELTEDGKDVDGRIKAKIRSNFNETAFFYPSILPGADNSYRFSFTVPDALTRWRMMAFAHTKNLRTGYSEMEIAARKEVMVMPNVPRFYREGDVVEFSAIVSNLSDQEANTTTRLRFIDPYTEKDITADFGSFEPVTSSIRSKESADVSWKFTVPKGHSLVAYVIETTSGQYSDAEQRAIPVLSNKILLTESKAFTKTSVGSSTFKLDKVEKLGAGTEKISLKLEVQTQPLWTTLMSLPYLIEYPYECAEQTFARFYGNALAREIIQQNPNFQRIVESWKSDDPKAFTAELEKNPELKAIILSETPWVLDAQKESEQRARLAALFDENTLNASMDQALNKLNELRTSDGCWGWFGKENSNIYITQHIVNGFAQLIDMGVEFDYPGIERAVNRLDSIYTRQYRKLTAKDKKEFGGLDELTVDWLIAREYFTEKDNEAVLYYRTCMENNWKSFNLYTQAQIGLDAVWNEKKAFAEKIRKSLLDRAIRNPELGMFWKENTYGYRWNESTIETQASLIRFFSDMEKSEQEVRDMQLWLLQNKRSNCWETTKATTNACYALLIDKETASAYKAQTVKVRMSDGTNLGTMKNDSGFERTWTGSDITNGKAAVIIESSTELPVFGAIHVTYLSEQSIVEKSNGDIRVERHIYKTVNNTLEEVKAGETVEVGTRLTVKVTVTANRSLEFVHVRSPHAFGFEVTDQLSGFHYGDVPYYQVNRDASAELFADYVRKGSSTFSYEVFATGRGELTVGPAFAECMYAPVFRANSAGMTMKVK